MAVQLRACGAGLTCVHDQRRFDYELDGKLLFRRSDTDRSLGGGQPTLENSPEVKV
jgi:hypothetical protein